MTQLRARGALDWFLRSRETGRITVWQLPNWWLVLWAALRLAEVVTHGTLDDVLRWAATLALAVWAGLEVLTGVNPFRRLLGAVVLAFLVVGLLR